MTSYVEIYKIYHYIQGNIKIIFLLVSLGSSNRKFISGLISLHYHSKERYLSLKFKIESCAVNSGTVGFRNK
jgi:hypothetical protein